MPQFFLWNSGHSVYNKKKEAAQSKCTLQNIVSLYGDKHPWIIAKNQRNNISLCLAKHLGVLQWFLFCFVFFSLNASPCGNQTIRWSQLIKLKTQELHVQRLLFETLKDLSTCTTGVHVLYLNSHWVHSTEEKKRRQWPMCTFFRFWNEINEY